MSNDSKSPKTEDIVATAEDGPEALSDEQVTEANGGWSWGVSQSTVVMPGGSTMVKPGINAETITASKTNDALEGAQLFGGNSIDTVSVLRKRPGR